MDYTTLTVKNKGIDWSDTESPEDKRIKRLEQRVSSLLKACLCLAIWNTVLTVLSILMFISGINVSFWNIHDGYVSIAFSCIILSLINGCTLYYYLDGDGS